MEEAHAKAVLDIVDADDGEVAGERRAARAYDEEEEAQFRVGKERAHIAPRRRPLPQEEVRAREQHGGFRREFRRDAAPFQHDAARVESRRRDRGQGEYGARQEAFAREQEEPERDERQAGVEERHLSRRRIHAPQERAEIRALLHRERQAEAAADLRHDRDEEAQEVHAADPALKDLPEAEGAFESRRREEERRRRKRRDAREEGVGGGKLAREEKGQRTQKRIQKPCGEEEDGAVRDADRVTMSFGEMREDAPEDEGERRGHAEGERMFVRPEDREAEGEKESRAL